MPDKNFWDERYKSGDTGWDAGSVTTPIKEFVDTLSVKDTKILIPGAGNAYEAEYLFRQGFRNVWVADISELPLRNFKQRFPEFPEEHLLHQDFFRMDSKFDLILEQTFFCALDPSLRKAYADKMHELLNPGGKLVGVLFDDPLNKDRPPFGGNKEEYLSYFAPLFTIHTFDRCYNSIAPRAGRELFMILEKG